MLSIVCFPSCCCLFAQINRVISLRPPKAGGLHRIGLVESNLTTDITVWYEITTQAERKARQRVRKTLERIIRADLPSMDPQYNKRCRKPRLPSNSWGRRETDSLSTHKKHFITTVSDGKLMTRVIIIVYNTKHAIIHPYQCYLWKVYIIFIESILFLHLHKMSSLSYDVLFVLLRFCLYYCIFKLFSNWDVWEHVAIKFHEMF